MEVVRWPTGGDGGRDIGAGVVVLDPRTPAAALCGSVTTCPVKVDAMPPT